jgi:hypothetical protein
MTDLSRMKALKRSLGNADRVAGEITKLALDPLRNMRKLEGRVASLERALEDLDGFSEAIVDLRAFSAHWRAALGPLHEESKKRFANELAQELAERGLALEGSIPDLRVDMFNLEFKADRGEVSIWYGPRQEQLMTCPADPTKVITGLEE